MSAPHWEPHVTRFGEELVTVLVKRRQELEMTQDELAEKIGVAEGLVGKWEIGSRKPSGFLFFCWVDALNFKIELKEILNGQV
tara:strand:+ start:594 stop:842 length:249 start_codon:yes stop_codon:yes gene_type:complete